MGVKYYVLIAFLVLLIPQLTLGAVTYSLDTDLSNSKTVEHGDSHTISYTFTNTNLACKITCTASMESSYYDTQPIEFTITTNPPVPKQFTLRSPSKSEANYEPDGSVQYSLDIDCFTVESIIPVCFEGTESVSPVTTDSKTFTLNYGLSSSERQAKSDYESLVGKTQTNIQNFYNRANEFDSFYDNLKGNVLIPSSLQKEVNRLAGMGNDALSDFEDSQDEYAVLDVFGALSTLSQYDNTNFDTLLGDVEDANDELEELQKLHDEIVQNLKNLKGMFTLNNEEFQRSGLKQRYLDLVSEYEDIQNDLETLQFSSYGSLRARMSELEEDYETLEQQQETRKQEIYSELNDIFVSETAKIEASRKLSQKSTLTATISLFCQEFQTTIPQDFREFNDAGQKRIESQNIANQERNTFLDSISPKWTELSQMITTLKSMATDATFDKELAQGCDVSPLVNSDFTQAQLDSAHTECLSFKQKIENSIAENQKVTSKFLNFFKYIFADKPELNQTQLPSLEGYYLPTNLVYTPVAFNDKTKNIINQHCEFNPETISLSAPRDVNQIGYDSSNTVIKFANIQGNCEELDCYNNRDTYPILFVHGHMFTDSKDPMVDSRYTFDKMIDYITSETDSTYDAGTIVDKGNQFLDSGLKTNPGVAMFRTTYYGYAYIDSSGNFQFEKRNYESIGEYANKLKGIIDATLETTGRKQVKIVSHSMGGLVVREYLRKYGSSKVDTFIMIGTPNQGIVSDIQNACDDFGADVECAQMAKGSSFLTTLSNGDKLPSRTYVISGTYNNEDTDGIVLKQNTALGAVKSYIYKSSKTYVYVVINWLLSNDLVHGDLVEPSMMLQVSDKTIELLQID